MYDNETHSSGVYVYTVHVRCALDHPPELLVALYLGFSTPMHQTMVKYLTLDNGLCR